MISELKPGMKIKSYDNGQAVFKEVTDVWNTEVQQHDQVCIKFLNATTVHCSINHPIMVRRHGEVVEVLPADLTTDDLVVSENGYSILEGVHIGQENAINYVDISVDDTHTFFTSDKIDGEMVLTHNSQGGIRSGAATLYVPIWHLEIENILTLKSNARSDETAVRNLDYGIQFSSLMYERLIQGKNITLFSPHQVQDMHDAFFIDQDKFKTLYEQYEKDPSKIKKSIPAIELFTLYHTQRKETGRIYKLNVDHANTHSSFIPEVAPIHMSNLCAEITLPTKPVGVGALEEQEIALCTLAAVNFGKVKDTKDLERPTELLVRALNELLDYQEYPVLPAKVATLNRRPLGIGLYNLAYWLAKNGYKYTDGSGLKHWDEMMESFQYYLIKASATVAKERGEPCPWFNETKYSKGIMPIDTYKKELDELVPNVTRMDWDWLRSYVAEHGMMNSTLSAGMPAETSAQISNGTNGFEAPRGFITVKGSGEGRLKQVVPGYPKLKSKYELLWDQKSPRGYLNLVAVSQKYFDQTISTNTFYNPEHFPNNEISMKTLIADDLYFYRLGGKTLYYCNTYDGATDEVEDDSCAGGGCKM